MTDWNLINVYNKHHVDNRVESTNDEGDDFNGSKFSGATDNDLRKDREQRSHSIDQQPLLSEPQREPVQIFPSDFGGYMLHPEHTLTQDSTLKQGSEDMASRNNDKPSGFDLYRLKTAPSQQQKPPGYEADPVLTHDKDVSFFGDSNVGRRDSRSTLDQDGLHRGSISTLPSAGNGRRLSHQRGVPISGIDDVLPSTNQSEESKSAPIFSNVPIGDKALQDNSNVSSKPAEEGMRRSSLFGMATAAVATVGAGAAAAASGVSNALMGGTDHQQDATKNEMPSTWPSSPSTNEASALGISATEGPGTKNATNCTYEPAIHGQTACFYSKDDVCNEVTKDKDHSMCEHVKEPSLHGQNPSFYGESGQKNDSIIKNQLPVDNVEQLFGSDQATQTFDSSHLRKNDNSFIHTALPVTNVDQTFSDILLAKHASTPDQATQTRPSAANASQTQGWSNGAGVDKQAAQIQSSDEHTDSHKGLLAAGGAGIGAAVGGILGKNASSKNDQGITGAPMAEDVSSTFGIQSKDMPISTAPVDSSLPDVGSSSIPSDTREPVTDKSMKKMGGIWSAGNLLSRNCKVSEDVGNAPQANEIKFNKKNLLTAGGIGGGVGAAVSGLLNRNNKVGDNKDLSGKSQGLNNDDITATAPQALANNNFVTAPQSDYEDKQVPTSTTVDNLTAPQTLAQGTDSTAPAAISQSGDISASQSVYDDSELPQTWGDQVIPVAPQITTDSETYNANIHQGYDGDQGVISLSNVGATQSTASNGIMNDSAAGSNVTDNSHQGMLAAGVGGTALGAGGILGLDDLMSSRNNKVDPSLATTDDQEFTDAPRDWSKDNDQNIITAQCDSSLSNNDRDFATTTAPQALANNDFKTDTSYSDYGDNQVPTSGTDQGLATAPQTLAQGIDSQGINSQGIDSQTQNDSSLSNNLSSVGTDPNGMTNQGVLAAGGAAAGAGVGGILSLGSAMASRSNNPKVDPQTLDSTTTQGFSSDAAPQALASNDFKSASLDDYGDNQVPTNDDSRIFDGAPTALAQGFDAAPTDLAQVDVTAPTLGHDNSWSKDDFVTTGHTVSDDSHHDAALAAGAGGILGSLALGNKNKEPLSESQTWSTATQGTYSPALAEVEDSPMTPMNHNAPKGWLSNSDGQTPQAIDTNQSIGAIPQDTHSNDIGLASDQGMATTATGQGANEDYGIIFTPEGWSNDTRGIQDQGVTTAPQALANNDVTPTPQSDLNDKQVPTSGPVDDSQGLTTAPQMLAATTQGNDKSHKGAIAEGVGAAAATVGGILGLRHHEQQDDTHPLSKTTTNRPNNDSESISSTRAITGNIVPSVRNQDEIKDRPIERHENFKNVIDSIDSDHHVMKATRKNSLTQGFKTKAAAATGAFTNAVRRLSSHGSGSSIKKDQIHVRRMSDAEVFKNQTLQEGQQHAFGNNEQVAFGGNSAFGNAGATVAAVLPNVIPHENLPPTTIPRTYENINGQDVPRSVETTNAQTRLENANTTLGDQTVPPNVESTQAKNLLNTQNDLRRESIPEQDVLQAAAVPQHTFMEESNSLGINGDPNSLGHLGEPTTFGDHGAPRRASSASSEHLKYTGVNQAYARIPGVYSMKPTGTNDVGQDGELNFVKNEEEVNKKCTPSKSSFFSGHVETRRGSIQKTVGRLFRNGSMQDKGALKQISGQKKINAYNATHNKL